MSQESAELVDHIRHLEGSPGAKFAGISGALRLLASWVLSIESRLKSLESLKNGNS